MKNTMQKLEINEDLFRMMIKTSNASAHNPAVEEVRKRLKNYDLLVDHYRKEYGISKMNDSNKIEDIEN